MRADGRCERREATPARPEEPGASGAASPLERRGWLHRSAAEEEMPRVLLTRRAVVAFAVFMLVGGRLPVLRAAQARRRRHDGAPHRARRQVVDRGRRGARAAVVRRLRRPVPRGLRRRGDEAHRLARELRDHDGRPRGDAAVRGGRRRRRRADRLGAAPLGHGAAPGGLPDGRLHGAAVCRSTPARC